MSTDTKPLEEAIHSIFGFIARTAEKTDGGITWSTIDYENQPHHSFSVFNGVGGIPYFLNDYYHCYGNSTALDLGQGAIDWCASFQGEHHHRGLHMGRNGAALAALHRAAVLGEGAPEYSHANARFILSEPPGPITDMLGGEASNGLYLVKLWAHTGETEFLQGAERCAIWLEEQMVRDEIGTYCYVDPFKRLGFGMNVFLGAAHGISGVAHFLVSLAEQTGNERWAELARELFATLTRYARPVHG